MIKKTMLFLLALGAIHCRGSELANLKAVFRNGQLFLQWKEKNLPKDCRLAVWSSPAPITKDNVQKALCVADLLNPKSAEDWWLDGANFLIPKTKKIKADEPFANSNANLKSKGNKRGFVISDKGKPIDPDGGLHVHTPGKGETGMRYFAVTAVYKKKICAFTALSKPVEVKEGKSSPIAVTAKAPGKGSGKGLPLVISLHGRGGGVGVDGSGRALGTHIIYASRDFAWREGIPFKFIVQKTDKYIRMTLFDRIWVGRIPTKSETSDGRDRVKAIATFWFGYNVNIARSMSGPEFVCNNYTERYILHLVRWAQEYLGTDPAAVYVTGGSMGGSGAIQLATRYPETFAAAAAMVPVYSYNWNITTSKNSKIAVPKSHTMVRLMCSTGKFSQKNPAVLPDGKPLLPMVDGAANINRPGVDITPIVATNGKQDMSIPWVNAPPFYRAANAARQAFSVYWNNGGHGMTGKSPDDMKYQLSEIGLLRYRLDKSYPAFSNCTANGNYGNGDPADGDEQGWINRGFSWNVEKVTPERYEITVGVNYPGIVYPVSADMTLRRRQQFKPSAGTVLKVQINGNERKIKVDENALITIEKIAFDNQKPLRVVITK